MVLNEAVIIQFHDFDEVPLFALVARTWVFEDLLLLLLPAVRQINRFCSTDGAGAFE